MRPGRDRRGRTTVGREPPRDPPGLTEGKEVITVEHIAHAIVHVLFKVIFEKD